MLTLWSGELVWRAGRVAVVWADGDLEASRTFRSALCWIDSLSQGLGSSEGVAST